MVTMASREVTVSTWGVYADSDEVHWQRWSVRAAGIEGRACYVELPLDWPTERVLCAAAALVAAGYIERASLQTTAPIRTLSPEEAEAQGFTIDRSCYPWLGYKGPRFSPDETVPIATPGPGSVG